MPRIARVVIPEYPHHVIHKANHGEKVFFDCSLQLGCQLVSLVQLGVGPS